MDSKRGEAKVTKRSDVLRKLGEQVEPWDVLVIGGGSSGFGAAVEAAARGYRTLLIERFDFAKGTSSRSTKLVHGGVRYLEQLNITLVLDALRERGHMLRNAPQLVHDLSFVVPAFSYFALPYYGFGLKVYEELSGRLSFGASKLLSREQTLAMLPGIVSEGLRGGVLYHDGQFDDARYIVTLLRTFQELGGTAINYVQATGLLHHNGKTVGVQARDSEGNTQIELQSKVMVNATGVFAEDIMEMDSERHESLLAMSQGTHFVLPHSFLSGGAALMVPKTADGRVLFAIPWHGTTLVGTTDEPVNHASTEPHSMAAERSFLFEHIHRYFGRMPRADEILSVWSGLRPLVRKGHSKTSKLSRDHTILVSKSGVVTVTGGKWTTYRRMGQDAIDHAAEVAGLPKVDSRTLDLRLHGWTNQFAGVAESDRVYGTDLPMIQQLSEDDLPLEQLLHPRLPYRLREVVWAARYEMARTVEDVLARRTRALFLDARAAIEAAPAVAALLAKELGRSDAWRESDLQNFLSVAQGYVYLGE
jgi:glycerol-3-phosphate dehydrogenase